MIFILIIIPIIVFLIITFTNNNTMTTRNQTNYIDDDCGSSQYIKYMKQFTPEQHQVEMDREVAEIWKNITYCDLND